MVVLKWILKPFVRGTYTVFDSSGTGEGQVSGCCEHGDEHSGSITCVNSVTSYGLISIARRIPVRGFN